MNTARHQIKQGEKGEKETDRQYLPLTRPRNECDVEINGSEFYANCRVIKVKKIFECRNIFRILCRL
jgi:hypothetical protein